MWTEQQALVREKSGRKLGNLLLILAFGVALYFWLADLLETKRALESTILIGFLILLRPRLPTQIAGPHRLRPKKSSSNYQAERLNILWLSAAVIGTSTSGLLQILAYGSPLYGLSFLLLGYSFLRGYVASKFNSVVPAVIIVWIAYAALVLAYIWVGILLFRA
jgi:hypothetical protein